VTFLVAAVALLGLVRKANPIPWLTSLGHATVRATSRDRRTVSGALAFVLGLAVWAAILGLVIAVGFYLYALFGGA
jgi:hypothetical protein